MSTELLVGYVRSRSAFRSRHLVAGVLSEMRGMGDYLVREGIWRTNPLRWMRGPKLDPRARLPRRVGKGALEKLWEAATEVRGEYRRYMWVAVLGVLYGTGLRRGELERLDVGDWNALEGTLLVDGVKTGRERVVPVSAGVRQCIEAYLPRRQNCLERAGCLEERALFVTSAGRRLDGPNIGKGVSRLAARAGIEHVTPHQFRHTCASDLLENGVCLPEVKEMLGHAVITSTMRYIHVAHPERRRAIDMHPINEMLPGARSEGEQR
jgi:integrase/recombinase XerD